MYPRFVCIYNHRVVAAVQSGFVYCPDSGVEHQAAWRQYVMPTVPQKSANDI